MLVDIRAVTIGLNGVLQYSDIALPVANAGSGALTISPLSRSVAAGSPTDSFVVGSTSAITTSTAVTLSDGGTGGVFNPTSITLQANAPTATFTYTPPGSSKAATTVTLTATATGLSGATASLAVTVAGGSISTPTSGMTAATLSNWNPQTQFAHATAAATAAINKSGTFRVIFVGDSLTSGVGAMNPYRLYSPPAYTSSALASVSPTLTGINQLVAGGDMAADNRLSFSGGTKFSGAQTFGGNVIQMPTRSDTCTVTFGISFDHVRVVYVDLGHAFDIGIDGIPTGKPAAAGSNTSAMLTQVWTVARGTHTITIIPQTTDVFVQSVEVWDSTVSGQVQVINGGQGGIDSNWLTQTTTFSNYTSGMLAEAADLAIINLGTNDLNNNGPNVQDFQSHIDTGVSLLQAQSCDVLLVFPPSVTSTGYTQNGDAYLAALRAVSTKRNVPLLDLRKFYGPVTAMPQSWIHDNVHKTEVFNKVEGTLYAKIIANAVGQASNAAASDVASYVG